MFDVIPCWMWAASLPVLALVCGEAHSAHDSARARHAGHRASWRVR